jgi:hypothetical protein
VLPELHRVEWVAVANWHRCRVIRNGYIPHHPYGHGYMPSAMVTAQCAVIDKSTDSYPTTLPSPILLPSRQSATKLELRSLFAEAQTLVFRLKLKSVAVILPDKTMTEHISKQPTRIIQPTLKKDMTNSYRYLR